MKVKRKGKTFCKNGVVGTVGEDNGGDCGL